MKKNQWMKRVNVLLLFIILILAGMLTSATATVKVDVSTNYKTSNTSFIGGNTIYVDDDNTAGPWNGTLEYPYQYIQDGIDNAEAGDIVYVFNGTYYENLIINKQIDLTGEQKEITIVDGSNNDKIISVTADHVNINGFTIQNCGSYFQDAGIYIRSNHIAINNTILCNNTEGIHLWDSQSNSITENTFTDCHYGLCLVTSDANSIKDNIFFNNNQGVSLEQSSNNDIHGNIISDNKDGIIVATNSNLNTIVGNHISNNTHYGIFMDRLFDKENTVYHNNFIDNYIHAHFETSLWMQWSCNYWDDWFGLTAPQYDFLPKLIVGRLIANILWINLDWNPAKEPFEM